MSNNQEVKIPNIFISYSWTTPEHEEWVLALATRLMENGVRVTLDKWDLVEGHDTYKFMESMVNSKDIDKVLIICDHGYMEKANEGRGGVGTEAQILSPEVYNHNEQEKFIPIVAERDEMGATYIPTFIKTRKYIDLSSPEIFEKGYEELIRNLYQRPQYRKPALGTAPAFLFEDEVPHFKTANINKLIDDAIQRNPQRIRSLTKNFTDAFIEALDQFQIEKVDPKYPLDQIIVDKINDMLPLRDDYIKFVELQCSAHEKVDPEIFIHFFESLMRFTEAPEGLTGGYYPEQWDHYKFLIEELFLYTITILLEYNQYQTASTLLHSEYFVKSRFKDEWSHSGYKVFKCSLVSLDEMRNKRLQLNLRSVAGDIMVQRSPKKYSKYKLAQVDLLLFYISVMCDMAWPWFPRLFHYIEYGGKVELLQRLKSNRYFEKVKVLFEVDTIDELKDKFQELSISKMREKRLDGIWLYIPRLESQIKTDEIGTLP